MKSIKLFLIMLAAGTLMPAVGSADRISQTTLLSPYSDIKPYSVVEHRGRRGHRHGHRHRHHRHHGGSAAFWAATAGALTAAAIASSHRDRVYRCRVWYRGRYHYGSTRYREPCVVRYRGRYMHFRHYDIYR